MRRITEAAAGRIIDAAGTTARPLSGDRDFRQCPLLRGRQGVAVEPWVDNEGNRWDDQEPPRLG